MVGVRRGVDIGGIRDAVDAAILAVRQHLPIPVVPARRIVLVRQWVVARADAAVRRKHDESRPVRITAEIRSEEHTSELQSLMRISYAVFCLKKKRSQMSIHTADCNAARSRLYGMNSYNINYACKS